MKNKFFILLLTLAALAVPVEASQFYTNDWAPPSTPGSNMTSITNITVTNTTGTPFQPVQGANAYLNISYTITPVAVGSPCVIIWSFQGTPQPSGTNLLTQGTPTQSTSNALFNVTNTLNATGGSATNGTYIVGVIVPSTSWDGVEQILPTVLNVACTNPITVNSVVWSQLQVK